MTISQISLLYKLHITPVKVQHHITKRWLSNRESPASLLTVQQQLRSSSDCSLSNTNTAKLTANHRQAVWRSLRPAPPSSTLSTAQKSLRSLSYHFTETHTLQSYTFSSGWACFTSLPSGLKTPPCRSSSLCAHYLNWCLTRGLAADDGSIKSLLEDRD